jgi:uncharacterized membrane protein YphA (DoxX/SURF4 family)
MSGRFATSARLPRSGNAALAAGALVQAAVGAEFVLAGLSKLVDAQFGAQFQGFVQGSPGAKSGPLAGIIQSLVLPNAELMAQLAQWTELVAGVILVLTALEVLRRRLAAPFGAQHAYEPPLALISSVAAFSLGAMSLSIYLIEGARLPMINPGFAFTSPIAIELFLVPLAFCVAWLEFARYRALR